MDYTIVVRHQRQRQLHEIIKNKAFYCIVSVVVLLILAICMQNNFIVRVRILHLFVKHLSAKECGCVSGQYRDQFNRFNQCPLTVTGLSYVSLEAFLCLHM